VEKRYSPAKYVSSTKEVIKGDPDPKHISTSYVERQNLTMRMGMRRFTRLPNGFSKKAENLMHAVSLHFMYYNFARIHQTLRVTPAMEAGITDHLWTVEDIARSVD
jgi:DNA helicase TIP49 (TBP-interacting protein)